MEEGVVYGEAGAAVFVGAVEVGDAAGGEVAQDVGVVGLPASVVSSADEGGADGVEGAGGDGAGAAIEVAWVLAEECGEDGAADDAADEDVAVGCSVALAEAFCSVAVAFVLSTGLFFAGDDAGGGEGDGVGGGADGEFELLAGGEGSGVPDEAGVEVGEDAEDALFDLGVDLLFGELLLGDGDRYVGGVGGYGQGDAGKLVALATADLNVRGEEGFKAGRADLDLVGSGGNVGEGEGAVAVGGDDAFFQAGLGDEGDAGVGYEALADVQDDSSDAAGG